MGSIQAFLDQYLPAVGGKADYIHGEDVVCSLAQKGAVGILLPVMEKGDLFPDGDFRGRAAPENLFHGRGSGETVLSGVPENRLIDRKGV